MTKRQNQIDTFQITTEKRTYIVTLERLKNDYNGNGRYKAVIVFIEPNEKSFTTLFIRSQNIITDVMARHNGLLIIMKKKHKMHKTR